MADVLGSSKMQLLAQLPRSCRAWLRCVFSSASDCTSASMQDEASASGMLVLKLRPLPLARTKGLPAAECAGESGGEHGFDEGSWSLFACCARGKGSRAATEDVRRAAIVSCRINSKFTAVY